MHNQVPLQTDLVCRGNELRVMSYRYLVGRVVGHQYTERLDGAMPRCFVKSIGRTEPHGGDHPRCMLDF